MSRCQVRVGSRRNTFGTVTEIPCVLGHSALSQRRMTPEDERQTGSEGVDAHCLVQRYGSWIAQGEGLVWDELARRDTGFFKPE